MTLFFDSAAQTYDLYARAQAACARDLWELSDRILPNDCLATEILDLGAGTGFCTLECAQRFPKAHYVLNDLSEPCLRQALLKFDSLSTELCAGAFQEGLEKRHWPLVISNFAIQWESKGLLLLEKILERSDSSVLAWPVEGSLAAWKEIAPDCQLSYLCPNDLHKVLARFERSKHIHLEFKSYTLEFDSLYFFLRSLHQIGAKVKHNAMPQGTLKALLKTYNQSWVDHYQVAFIIAYNHQG